jgi:hypothetical protein
MATATFIFTSNADGTISGTCSSAPEVPSGNHKSLKALMQWMKGIAFTTLVQGSAVGTIGSD